MQLKSTLLSQIIVVGPTLHIFQYNTSPTLPVPVCAKLKLLPGGGNEG